VAKRCPHIRALELIPSTPYYAMSKTKTILDRIKRIKEAIIKAHEYLETGAHADWHGFRPLFYGKVKDGKTLPPHKDWVKNVFLPSKEKAMRNAEKTLDKLE
jgi:hypothetical protein